MNGNTHRENDGEVVVNVNLEHVDESEENKKDVETELPDQSATREDTDKIKQIAVDPFAEVVCLITDSSSLRKSSDGMKNRYSLHETSKLKDTSTSSLNNKVDPSRSKTRPKSDYYQPDNPFVVLRNNSEVLEEQSQELAKTTSSSSNRSSRFHDVLDYRDELSSTDKVKGESNSDINTPEITSSPQLSNENSFVGDQVNIQEENSPQNPEHSSIQLPSSDNIPLPPPPPKTMYHQQICAKLPSRPPLPFMPQSSAFLKELTDPSKRKPLRKLSPVPKHSSSDDGRSNLSGNIKPADPIKIKMSKEEAENKRSELLIQLLGFMEAPAGNLEDLMEKCKDSTMMVRSLLYTLIRRYWIAAVRVLDKPHKKKSKNKDTQNGKSDDKPPNEDDTTEVKTITKHKHKSKSKDKQKVRDKTRSIPPVTIWPGKEWSDVITLEDVSAVELQKLEEARGLVNRVHFYRFDIASKKHTLDIITLLKGPKFPAEVPAFSEPPPPKPTTLEEMNAYEEWVSRRLKYEQCDWAQYNLIYRKLLSYNAQTQTKFQTLVDTVNEIRRIGEKLRNLFKKVPIEDMKLIVERIPDRIKEVKNQVQNESGIIIRAEDLKLTPEFISKYGVTLSPSKVLQDVNDK